MASGRRLPIREVGGQSAAENQLSSDRYIADNWQNQTLDSSNGRLYQLDLENADGSIGAKSSYFIDDQTYKNYLNDKGEFDVKRYCEDAQIAPHESGTYKNHISAYDIPNGTQVSAEAGFARANTAYGQGGAHQYYIPEDQWGKLQPAADFQAPTISDEARTIGKDAALDKIVAAGVKLLIAHIYKSKFYKLNEHVYHH